MRLWTNSEGDCLNCCLASLLDVDPADVPVYDGRMDSRLDEWLAERGKRLEEVWPARTWGETFPLGEWIALLGRGPRVTHAVLARAGEIIHDPGFRSGWTGTLWPSELAGARDSEIPLGFRLEAV